MSQQLTALPEKTQQQALRRVSEAASAPRQSGQLPSPILQLQRLLGECKTRFAPELENLLKEQITWEATMSGASTTVNMIENCRATFVDACAADLMQAGSDDLLKHEQTHFDLTDAMAQKAQMISGPWLTHSPRKSRNAVRKRLKLSQKRYWRANEKK